MKHFTKYERAISLKAVAESSQVELTNQLHEADKKFENWNNTQINKYLQHYCTILYLTISTMPLILLHSEWSKYYRDLAILSVTGTNKSHIMRNPNISLGFMTRTGP